MKKIKICGINIEFRWSFIWQRVGYAKRTKELGVWWRKDRFDGNINPHLKVLTYYHFGIDLIFANLQANLSRVR